MLALFIHPFVLCIILHFIARDTSEYYSFFRVLLIVFSVSLVSAILYLKISPIALLAFPALLIFALMRFCYVSFVRSLLATVLFSGYLIAWERIF